MLNSFTLDTSLRATPAAANAGNELDLGAVEPYTWKTGLFTLDVPKGWVLQDLSQPNVVIAVWTTKTGDAALSATLTEADTTYTAAQLTEVGNTFINNAYVKQDVFKDNFKVEETKMMDDTTAMITWSSNLKLQSGVVPIIGAVFVTQAKNKLSVLAVYLPADRTDQEANVKALVSSYKIDPSAALNK